MTAAEVMHAALLALVDHEKRPPCGDRSGSGRWTSDDRTERARVSRLCASCSVRGPCADLAAELKPSAGVWSGTDWTRRTYTRRTP